MIKYYDQRQESILAYSSKEGVHNGQEGKGAVTEQGWQITFHLHIGN